MVATTQKYKLGVAQITRLNDVPAVAIFTDGKQVYKDMTTGEWMAATDKEKTMIMEWLSEGNKTEPKEAFLIYNKNNRDEHLFVDAKNEDEALEYVLKNMDSSKYWVAYSVEYLLKAHKAISDSQGFDYEFNYSDDIINNEGAYIEVLDLMDRFPTIKPFPTSAKEMPCFVLRDTSFEIENIPLECIGINDEGTEFYKDSSNNAYIKYKEFEHPVFRVDLAILYKNDFYDTSAILREVKLPSDIYNDGKYAEASANIGWLLSGRKLVGKSPEEITKLLSPCMGEVKEMIHSDVAAMSDSEREAAMDEIEGKSDRNIDLTQ